jgi:hypothetical protein
MQLQDTRVTPETPGMKTYRVDFVGEGGEAISVTLKDQTSEADFTSDGLIMKAKAMMVQVATMFDDGPAQFKNAAGADEPAHAPTDGSAAGSDTHGIGARRTPGRAEDRETLEERFEDSFPASDPDSVVSNAIPGQVKYPSS